MKSAKIGFEQNKSKLSSTNENDKCLNKKRVFEIESDNSIEMVTESDKYV